MNGLEVCITGHINKMNNVKYQVHSKGKQGGATSADGSNSVHKSSYPICTDNKLNA
jgi:hypothetical protein